MGLRNTSAQYGSLAKWLHWLVAILVVYLIYLGLQQSDMESGGERAAVRALHASVALLVLSLMLIRLIWRLLNESPAHPDGIPAWQRGAATLVHWGLYGAVFVQLTAGAMIVATDGKPVPFFGLFSLPLPVAEDHDAHELWEEVHEVMWSVIALLVAVHVLGALYNHFVLKNDVLRCMTHGVKKDH
ncbi:MAG TPA: cytochrome b [Woeseiaceae bacterium]|jgi:cytochrome b561|nr:cytochrome b [Woeseiaceae bacterium]